MIEGKTTKAQRWWWFGNSQYQEYLDAIDEVWAKRIAITDTFRDDPNLTASKNPVRASEERLLLRQRLIGCRPVIAEIMPVRQTPGMRGSTLFFKW